MFGRIQRGGFAVSAYHSTRTARTTATCFSFPFIPGKLILSRKESGRRKCIIPTEAGYHSYAQSLLVEAGLGDVLYSSASLLQICISMSGLPFSVGVVFFFQHV